MMSYHAAIRKYLTAQWHNGTIPGARRADGMFVLMPPTRRYDSRNKSFQYLLL